MSERPKFIETFGSTQRVGILENDSWLVLWRQPNGTLVPHHHNSVWSVLDQTQRVIRRFLGVPIDEAEKGFADPNLSVSLPILKQAIILGETQKAQNLAGEITDLMSLSVNRHTPSAELAEHLNRLKDKLGKRVRNEFKVTAFSKLMEAENAGTLARMHLTSMEAYEALIMRAREGMSITASLMERTTALLTWADEQEEGLRRLKNAVGAALKDLRTGLVPQSMQELWYSGLFGTDLSPYPMASKIRGNPYAQIVQREEIKGVGRLQEMMHSVLRVERNPLSGEQLGQVSARFEGAYIVLFNVAGEREHRKKSGKWDRYL